MGRGLQLRDPGAITVAVLAAGAAWAIGVRPSAAGALGLTVLTVKGLTGLVLTRSGENAEVLAVEAPTDIGPPEPVAAAAAAAAGTAEPGDAGEGDGHVFRREGEYWRIGSGEIVLSYKDSKGLRYLHCLLSNPGQEVHAVQLAQEGKRSVAPGPRTGLPEGTSIGGDGSLPVLDDQSKAKYREKIRLLEVDLEEAKALNDEGRVYSAELELEAVKRELLRAIGIGGRNRTTAGPAVRAANNVTRNIQDAIDRIAEHDAVLAHHLRSTVHRGKFCRYDPGPGERPNWRL